MESEAKIVRYIYDLYLQGKTINAICRILTDQRISTPGGKEKWGVATVNSILQNEKYVGNARLQKTFCTSYLTKQMKKNEGELPMYFIEGSHPGIVSESIFNLVQEEIAKNRALGKKRRASQIFSSMVYCGECSGAFGSKTWGSNTPYRRRVWQCNEKYRVKGEVNCNTPALTDDELKRAFVFAFNQILKDKNDYIAAYEPIIEMLTDTSKYDSEINALQERCNGFYAEIEQLIKDNAIHARSQDEYRLRYAELAEHYESLKTEIAKLEKAKLSQILRREKILRFLKDLRGKEGLLQEFDEGIFRALTDKMVVYSKVNVAVTFRDGHEVHVNPQI